MSPRTALQDLQQAAADGDVLRMQHALDDGADINDGSPVLGDTALIVAVDNNHLEAVRWLLEHGADVNVPNAEGEVPLHFAARHSTAMWNTLIAYGGNDQLRDLSGVAPKDLRFKLTQRRGIRCGR
jgi:ankyrin repeat protein